MKPMINFSWYIVHKVLLDIQRSNSLLSAQPVRNPFPYLSPRLSLLLTTIPSLHIAQLFGNLFIALQYSLNLL